MNLMAKVVFVISFVVIMAGCASTHMTDVQESARIFKPTTGKSLVVFMRPSFFGGAIQCVLYDEDTYFGTLSAGKQIAYETTPGHHMFMVVSEAADFLSADLAADKTYYAAIVPRPGFIRARFSFMAQNGQIKQETLDDWLASTTQVTVNEEGLKWAENNSASVTEKKAKYLVEWQSKPEKRQQKLFIESGK